jgi:hypothetical protein
MPLYSDHPRYVTSLPNGLLVAIPINGRRLITRTFTACHETTEALMACAVKWRDRAWNRLFGMTVPTRSFRRSARTTSSTGIPGARLTTKDRLRLQGGVHNAARRGRAAADPLEQPKGAAPPGREGVSDGSPNGARRAAARCATTARSGPCRRRTGAVARANAKKIPNPLKANDRLAPKGQCKSPHRKINCVPPWQGDDIAPDHMAWS